MQLLPRYLVKNRINVIADLAGFITEYRPVYNRTIKVYKGIDNVLEFRMLNADQKPINTQGYTPRFLAFDENKNLVIEHEGTILDDGSSATKGLFTVTISEQDLLNLQQQFLSYTVYVEDVNGTPIITYSDTHFGNDGVIELSAEAFPGAKSSKSVTSFTKLDINTSEYITDSIDAEPGINGNEALHTAAIYSNGYVGNVYIEGTLENQVTDYTNWAILTTAILDGTETEPTAVNFNGVINFIRFRTDVAPTDKITKILVRN